LKWALPRGVCMGTGRGRARPHSSSSDLDPGGFGEALAEASDSGKRLRRHGVERKAQEGGAVRAVREQACAAGLGARGGVSEAGGRRCKSE